MVFVGFHVVVLRFPRVCSSTSVSCGDLSLSCSLDWVSGKSNVVSFRSWNLCEMCDFCDQQACESLFWRGLYSLIDFNHRLKRKVEPPRQRRDCERAFGFLPLPSPSTFADRSQNAQVSSQDLFYQLRVSKFPPNSLLDLKSSSWILIINRLQLSSSDYSESPRRSLRITIGTVTASRSSSRVRLYLASPLHASSSELLPSSSHYA